jgi:hypothetical protein
MNTQFNNKAKQPASQAANRLQLGGELEGKGSTARYISQLQNMLSTARRNNWKRVVFSLSSLITLRGGIA